MDKARLSFVALVLLLLPAFLCAQETNVVDMSFAGDSHGWLAVMDPQPAIFRTVNGGQSWTRIAVPGFYRINFFDHSTGVAIKEVSNKEFAIYRTSDGGDHWQVAASVKDDYVHAVATGWANAEEAFILGRGYAGRGWVAQLSTGKALRVRTDLPTDFSTQSNTLGI